MYSKLVFLLFASFIWHPATTSASPISHSSPSKNAIRSSTSVNTDSHPIARNLPPNLQKSWIIGFYDMILQPNEKKVFDKTLDVTPEMSMGSQGGKYNAGLWVPKQAYKGIPAKDIVAKEMLSADEKAAGEVKALKVVGYLIDSGKVNGKPTILMKRIPGKILTSWMMQWVKATGEKQREILGKMKADVKKQVKKWAKKGLLHTDFHIRNIHVEFKGNNYVAAHLLDLGYPGVFAIDAAKVTDEELDGWFETQWAEKISVKTKP